MSLARAVLQSFNSSNYTATVQLAASYKVYLEEIAVAACGRNGRSREGSGYIL